MAHASLYDRLRNPEYTGERRCLPCTAVNTVIAIGVSIAVGFVSPLAGALTFGACLATIGLRGYLVPGTPTLTKRYLPDRVRRRFGKGDPIDPPAADVDPETHLVESGVVVEDPASGDLVVEPEFGEEWRERAARIGSPSAEGHHVRPEAALAELVDTDAERIELVEDGRGFRAYLDDSVVGTWESRPAFLADVAAAPLLNGRSDEWERLPLAARSEILGALRLFLERCPGCGGRVSFDQEVVESCCYSYDVVAGACDGCGARLFEMRIDPDAIPDESL